MASESDGVGADAGVESGPPDARGNARAPVGTPPQVPSFFHAVRVVTKLQTLRTRRGRKLRLAVGAAAALLLALAAARFAPASGDAAALEATERAAGAWEAGVSWGLFGLMVFLTPFLMLAGAISEEVERRTLPFLTSRPIDRISLTLGKYLAGASATLAILLATLVALYVIAFAATPGELVENLDDLGRKAGALALLGATYSAICLLWGALVPEAGGVMAALHLAVVEVLGSGLPGPFRLVSLLYHGSQIAGLEPGGMFPENAPEVEPLVAAAVLTAFLLIFLALAALVVRITEYRFASS